MFESLLSWVLKAITGALEGVLTAFTTVFAMNLETFVEYFPAAGRMYYIIRSIALGLVIGIAIINILKFFMAPLGRVSDSPAMLLVRTFMAIGFVYFGGYILEWIIDVFKGPYSKLLGFDESIWFQPSFFSTFCERLGRGFAGITIGAKNIISLVAIIALGINIIKFILEFVERWIMVGVLAYTGPLGWSTLASASTMGIFQKWINMFLSQCIMMLISAWSIKMMFSVMGNTDVEGTQLFYRLIAALAFCRVAQRFDSYIQQLGLNATTTGGSMLDEIIGTAKTASALFHKGSGRGGRSGGDDEASVLGATGAGGSLGAGLFVGGFAGAGAVAGARAARGMAKGYAAARKDGASIGESIKQGGKQAKNNLKDMVSPENSAVGKVINHATDGRYGQAVKDIESNVRRAMSLADAGDTSQYDLLTTAEKGLAAKYREEDAANLPLENGNIGGFTDLPDGGESDAGLFDEQAENAGFFAGDVGVFESFDGEEDVRPASEADAHAAPNTERIIGSEKGEGYTAAFIEKNLNPSVAKKDANGNIERDKATRKPIMEARDVTDSEFAQMNNTVRHMKNSDYAMDISVPKHMSTQAGKQDRYAGNATTRDKQLWASTVASAGVGTSDSFKKIEKESTPTAQTYKRMAKSIEKLSYGVDDGNIEHTANVGWEKNAGSGGHQTSFRYNDNGTKYDVTIMDKQQYDQYSRTAKDAASKMHSFTDRGGNIRYIAMDPSAS